MKICCPFCEEEITNNIKLKRTVNAVFTLTTEFCDEDDENKELDIKDTEEDLSEDEYECGECGMDITNFILSECDFWFPY